MCIAASPFHNNCMHACFMKSLFTFCNDPAVSLQNTVGSGDSTHIVPSMKLLPHHWEEEFVLCSQ